MNKKERSNTNIAILGSDNLTQKCDNLTHKKRQFDSHFLVIL